MKNAIVLFFLILFPTVHHAQDSLIIYNTFKDYQKNKGELKTGNLVYSGTTTSFGKKWITLKNKTPNTPKAEKKIKIYSQEIWGLKLNNVLFRTKESGTLACLMSEGEFFYYENGLVNIRILLSRRPRDTEHLSKNWGARAYFSTEINSELIRIPGYGEFGRKKATKNFIRDYPELKEFFTCVKSYRYPILRKCVEEINGGKLPDRKVY